MDSSFKDEYPLFEMKYEKVMNEAKTNLVQAKSGSMLHQLSIRHDYSICKSKLETLIKECERSTYGSRSQSKEMEKFQKLLSCLIKDLKDEIILNSEGSEAIEEMEEEFSTQMAQDSSVVGTDFYERLIKQKQFCSQITSNLIQNLKNVENVNEQKTLESG